MLKRMVLLTLFCLLASPFGISSYAHRSLLKIGREATPVQDAKSSNAQGDEAGGIELAEKNRAAMGVRDQNRVKTEERHAEVEAMGQLNKITRITERSTRRFYSLTEGPNGNREMGFDGKRVWQKTPFFRGYLADDDPMARPIIKGENESPLLNYKTTGRKLYRLPNETLDGKEYLIVRTTTKDPADREIPIKFYLDPATYFLRRTVTGAAITQTSILEDYRQVDGEWIAFTVTTITPQATVVRRIKSVKHNITIDPAKFEYHDDDAKPENVKPESTKEGGNPLSPAVAAASDDLIPEAKRIEAFELAWKTVNDTYWDRTFNGVNWKAIHEKYLPLIKAAAKGKEFHELLNLMVQELHLSHFKIMPPENVVGLDTRAEDLKNGDIGAAFRWLDGQLVVVDLDKDYSAYAAGIRKGFVVTKINGKTPEEIYQEEKKKKGGYEPREGFARVRAAGSQLGGKLDVPVKLEVLNEQDKRIQLEVTRKARQLSGRQLEFEFEKLDNNIGYIKFNLFFGDLLPKVQAALRELRDTEALIIDLRGNPGGAGDLAPALANLLSANAGSLGSLQFRYASQPYAYKGTGDQAYKGKVILLVDEHSGSTAEVFSGGLQENKRVTVIGTPTAGGVLPSLYRLLPTGGVLQHVISNFQTPKGVVLEGRGVLPDITATLSRKDLLAGRDPVRERAIQFIKMSK